MALNVDKPPRTLGMMLAIGASALLFGILPLMQIGAIVLVQMRLQSGLMSFPSGQGDAGQAAIQVGGDFLGVNPVSAVAQAALALGFLVLCMLAWRVRRPRVRLAFVLAVLTLSLISVIVTVASAQSAALDSGADLSRQLSCGVIGAQVLVPLYVVWYMSRAPARAYYRGSWEAPVDRPAS